jgi:hypothetical protein
VVRAGARFDANQTRWQVHEKLRKLSSPQLFAQHGLAALINPVNLKTRFSPDQCRPL